MWGRRYPDTTVGSFSQNRLWFGDLGSATEGASSLDYLRVYKGANGLEGDDPQPTDFSGLPFATSADFAVNQAIDIGDDLIGTLGQSQTFFPDALLTRDVLDLGSAS